MSGDSTDPPPPVLDPRRALSFYRVERGLSQTGLAAKLGVSQPYVARLESGDQSTTLTTLARLAQRLGLEFHIDVTPTDVRMSA
ncbi:MAG: helix-turn-helix domain-containing protein [Pseudonocardiaceae bacterium]